MSVLFYAGISIAFVEGVWSVNLQALIEIRSNCGAFVTDLFADEQTILADVVSNPDNGFFLLLLPYRDSAYLELVTV